MSAVQINAYQTHEGAWSLSAIVGSARYHRLYYFYTKREALQLFRAYVREGR